MGHGTCSYIHCFILLLIPICVGCMSSFMIIFMIILTFWYDLCLRFFRAHGFIASSCYQCNLVSAAPLYERPCWLYVRRLKPLRRCSTCWNPAACTSFGAARRHWWSVLVGEYRNLLFIFAHSPISVTLEAKWSCDWHRCRLHARGAHYRGVEKTRVRMSDLFDACANHNGLCRLIGILHKRREYISTRWWSNCDKRATKIYIYVPEDMLHQVTCPNSRRLTRTK